VHSRTLNTGNVDAEMMCWRKLFQKRAAAIRNDGSPTVERHVW